MAVIVLTLWGFLGLWGRRFDVGGNFCLGSCAALAGSYGNFRGREMLDICRRWRIK